MKSAEQSEWRKKKSKSKSKSKDKSLSNPSHLANNLSPWTSLPLFASVNLLHVARAIVRSLQYGFANLARHFNGRVVRFFSPFWVMDPDMSFNVFDILSAVIAFRTFLRLLVLPDMTTKEKIQALAKFCCLKTVVTFIAPKRRDLLELMFLFKRLRTSIARKSLDHIKRCRGRFRVKL